MKKEKLDAMIEQVTRYVEQAKRDPERANECMMMRKGKGADSVTALVPLEEVVQRLRDGWRFFNF